MKDTKSILILNWNLQSDIMKKNIVNEWIKCLV